MKRRALWGMLVFSAVLAGCGPSVGEARMASYPPRAEDCTLEFVKGDMQLVSPGGPWELIGHVIVGEHGSADVLSDEHREIVRPRACKMGGEAIMIAVSATNPGVAVDGSSTMYGVLRKRRSGEQAVEQF